MSIISINLIFTPLRSKLYYSYVIEKIIKVQRVEQTCIHNTALVCLSPVPNILST